MKSFFEECKPTSLCDWVCLPFRIFLLAVTFLVTLPLAIIATVCLACSGFGTVWGKKYIRKGERKEKKGGETENDSL